MAKKKTAAKKAEAKPKPATDPPPPARKRAKSEFYVTARNGLAVLGVATGHDREGVPDRYTEVAMTAAVAEKAGAALADLARRGK